MRSFITGVDGFIGSWLAEALRAAGDEVFGLSRRRSPTEGRDDGVVRLLGDVTSRPALSDAIAAARPDRVFHLAALNNIRESFDDPARTIETNVIGSLNLLDAVRLSAPAASVVSVGSS
ncbi:MAG TPA: NAD-dependent epimerase/dehydratase family protein, partial [Polyangia bacterium]